MFCESCEVFIVNLTCTSVLPQLAIGRLILMTFVVSVEQT